MIAFLFSPKWPPTLLPMPVLGGGAPAEEAFVGERDRGLCHGSNSRLEKKAGLSCEIRRVTSEAAPCESEDSFLSPVARDKRVGGRGKSEKISSVTSPRRAKWVEKGVRALRRL